MPDYTPRTDVANNSVVTTISAATGSSCAEFDSLTREQKLRFLRRAQAALRFLQADLTDDPDQIIDRRNALANLATGMLERGWRTELTVEAALPSYRPYWDAYTVAHDLVSALEGLHSENENADPLENEGVERLGRVLEHLLLFARDEAEVVGINLDEMMRGWFASHRVPTGSPTAGTSQ